MKRFLLLIALCAATHPALAARGRVLRLQTPDDVAISALYYAPPSGTTNRAPAVLFLHSLGEDRDEWGSFPSLLNQNGFAVMAIDFRGHGDSTRRVTASGAQVIDHRSFGPRDYQNMLLDINTAVDWLEEQPNVDKDRIVLIGSSLGANLAVRYATEHTELTGLLLFSPGMTYRDVRIDDAFPKLRRMPLRVVVSLRDTYAFESSKRLLDQRREAGRARDFHELIVCSGSLHGAEQLKNVKELTSKLVRWLRQILFNEEPEEPVAPTAIAPVAPPVTNATPAKPAKPYKPQRPLP